LIASFTLANKNNKSILIFNYQKKDFGKKNGKIITNKFLKEAKEKEDPSTALTDTQIQNCSLYATRKIFEAMDSLFGDTPCSFDSLSFLLFCKAP
jgi:hypothetical protein